MKKILFSAFALLLMSSCMPKLVPLKGNYPETPIIYSTSNSFNAVWDKLVDFFAQKGYSIKIIDRSSGLIVASATKMDACYESKKGVPVRKSAIVVVPRYKLVDPQSKYTADPVVIGDWNVRIKETNGQTSININLVNIQQEDVYNSTRGPRVYSQIGGRTTGVFEKMIYEAIK